MNSENEICFADWGKGLVAELEVSHDGMVVALAAVFSLVDVVLGPPVPEVGVANSEVADEVGELRVVRMNAGVAA